jgi:outer membrane protein insertion porin family
LLSIPNSCIKPEIIKPLIPFGKGAIVVRDDIVSTIKDLYKLGYFREIETYTRFTENGIDLIFVFKELPVVQKIEFEGNDDIPSDDLMQELGIESKREEVGTALFLSSLGPELSEKLHSLKKGLGRVFSIEEIEKMRKKILKYYEKKGYYNAKVSYYFKGNTLVFKIDEGKKAYIKEIIIIGNKQLDEDEIEDVMETKERNVWKLRFHPRLEKEVLYEDIERIRQLYIDKGFFEVEVKEPKIELKNGEEYYIIIEIKEGPRYKLSALEFKNNTLYTKDEILERFKRELKIGDYYNGELIKKIKEEIVNKYTELGYLFARVEDEKILDRQNKQVKVVYDIQKGNLYYVNFINISGNYESRDYVIRRELRFAPGDLFKRKDLFRSQARLYRLGFYNGIGFNPKFRDDNKLDVDVNVQERFTGQISIGAGYSQLTGLSFFASIKKGNFMGTGDTLGLSLSIGSQYRNNEISYLHKWAFYKPIDLRFSLYDKYVDYGTFISQKLGFSPGISMEFKEYYRTGIGITLEKGNIKDVQPEAPIYIQRQSGEYDLYSIYWFINRNDVDNPILPTQGSDLSLNIKTGTGTRDFYKIVSSATFIIPDHLLWTDFIFSFKVRYGLVRPINKEIPLDEYFFVGGDFTIRGFDYGMAGPYDEALNPLGAENELILNYQLNHPLVDKFLWGYVFVDQGRGFNSFDELKREIYTSYGFGIKIVTPMAPIDIYYGVVANPPPNVGNSRFGFVLGTFF